MSQRLAVTKKAYVLQNNTECSEAKSLFKKQIFHEHEQRQVKAVKD